MVTSILVGVDDSDGARDALRWGAEMVASERERGRDPRAVDVVAACRTLLESPILADKLRPVGRCDFPDGCGYP